MVCTALHLLGVLVAIVMWRVTRCACMYIHSGYGAPDVGSDSDEDNSAGDGGMDANDSSDHAERMRFLSSLGPAPRRRPGPRRACCRRRGHPHDA